SSACPLCSNAYAQLSQHLRVTHKVLNLTERRLILSLESGRVRYREGTCGIPGCRKMTSRLDCHIRGHTELSKEAQRNLAALRASCPAIPMATFLDIDESQNLFDDSQERRSDQEEEEEEEMCSEEKCQRARAKFLKTIAELNKQNDTLAAMLQEVTRRFKKLKRKTSSMPSSQVCSAAKKLLSTLEAEEGGEPEEAAGEPSEEAAGEPSVQPGASTTQPEPQDDLPYFPEHVVALNEVMNEYKSHQEGSDPSAKLKNNVASKIFRIKHFLGYMAEGKSSLANLLFLNDTAKIRQWMAKLRSSKITETTIHHYLKNVAQFLDYVAETPPATSRLSKAVLVGIRREVRTLIKGMRRRVVTHEYAVKTAKEGKRLKTTPTSKDQWMFYGHLTAYLATIYGHRGGMFQNMLVEEVTGARKTDPAGNFLINVSNSLTRSLAHSLILLLHLT
ncbi:hypothetical protein IRJ41_019463, partial [Triplophysa rosa]